MASILYSTNTALAFRISRRYYGDKHYVYCTSRFGSSPTSGNLGENPPTSSPRWRYRSLHEVIEGGDLHASIIDENKAGLRRGVLERYSGGDITENERDEILSVIDLAAMADFRPLLYVMSYTDVEDLLVSVPVANRAHPLAEEYIIENLPGEKFDVLDVSDL